tara:strand:- start:2773 stop:3042 length:270 start_codon:yes stop_codon:yes gene_type:complete
MAWLCQKAAIAIRVARARLDQAIRMLALASPVQDLACLPLMTMAEAFTALWLLVLEGRWCNAGKTAKAGAAGQNTDDAAIDGAGSNSNH